MMKYLLILVILTFSSLKIISQDFTFKEKKELSGYSDYIMDARFSPYRNYFAIAIGNNTIEIYDKDWKKIFTHQGNPKSVGGQISFSPDEKYLAYAKYKSDNDIAIIRLEDKKVIQVLNGHAQHINKIEFSHNGKYLASTSSDETVCVWIWKDDQLILLQKFIYDDAINGASFSFDDKFLATGGNNSKIHIYQNKGEKYELFDSIPLKYRQNDVCFHPSKYDLVASSQNDIRIYRIVNQAHKFIDSLDISVNYKVKYNSTGDYLVFGEYQDAVILDARKEKMKVFDNIYRHSDYVFGGNFSDDGKFLTTFGSDKSCIVWELTGIEPSRKSLISEYMNSELTSAQKIILTSDVIENILEKLDEKLILPRNEFETTIQFNDRKSKLKSEVLALLQFYTEKHYGVKSKTANKITIPIERIIGYNADLQIYKIRFMETDAGISIPVEDAITFKKNWERAYLQADKAIGKDGISYEYSNFELVHPSNNKTYSINPVENPFHIQKIFRNSNIEKGRSDATVIEKPKENSVENTMGTNRALIFATSIYDSFSELVNPVIDASTIAEELQSNYFVQTELIVNPTLNETIQKIREYAKLQYNLNDNLVIFFAGHGIYDEVFKEGYVISRDSKSDDVAKTSYLSHSNLRTMINNIPCNHILLVMDVCFGGTFDPIIASKSRAADMYTEVTNEEFIQRKQKYKTRLYLTSGGKEYVPDGRPGHHSPFARKFLESLRNYGGDDRILTMNEIIQYIEKVEPQPRFGEFGDNEPGSDFLMLVK